MNILTTPVAWTTKPEANTPALIQLEFSTQELFRIGFLQELIHIESLDSIRILKEATYLENEDQVSNFKADVQVLVIYAADFHFHAQSSEDSTVQLESEAFTIEEISQFKRKPVLKNS